MFDTIIVPLDGSSTAEVALPYAEELAGRLGAELVLVFVTEPNDHRSGNIIQCYLENTVQKAEKAAAKFITGTGFNQPESRTILLNGNPAEEIINFAENQKGSLIVMATHGQSGPNTRWALGSVVDKVIKATTTPVNIIRAAGDKTAVHEAVHLEKILVPLDGSKESEATLPYAKELARLLKAEVTLLKVNEFNYEVMSMEQVKALDEARKSAEYYLDKLTDDFRQSGIKTECVAIEGAAGAAAEEINKYTRENPTDVVIMATHGRSGPRRWLLGSVANKVMLEGNTPIIMVRTPGTVKG
jgi:nucleotide-binding universal stress UspA family protein